VRACVLACVEKVNCALCQFAVVVSMENQIMLSGFVLNARRYPNEDPTRKAHADQATRLFLDPDHLMSPVHQASVALYMLDRKLQAKITSPSLCVNARYAK
jgi:hypothetical protein